MHDEDNFNQTDFINLADPATCLASNSVLGSLYSPESSLFTQFWKKYKNLWVLYRYVIRIVNINILSFNLLSKTT